MFKEVFGWYAELLVELKHCFKHFYYLWRAFWEALAQCGSFSLWADLLGIFNGSFVGEEWEIVSIKLTKLVEYFDELIVIILQRRVELSDKYSQTEADTGIDAEGNSGDNARGDAPAEEQEDAPANDAGDAGDAGDSEEAAANDGADAAEEAAQW